MFGKGKSGMQGEAKCEEPSDLLGGVADPVGRTLSAFKRKTFTGDGSWLSSPDLLFLRCEIGPANHR
jgi:hypothetical protein